MPNKQDIKSNATKKSSKVTQQTKSLKVIRQKKYLRVRKLKKDDDKKQISGEIVWEASTDYHIVADNSIDVSI